MLLTVLKVVAPLQRRPAVSSKLVFPPTFSPPTPPRLQARLSFILSTMPTINIFLYFRNVVFLWADPKAAHKNKDRWP